MLLARLAEPEPARAVGQARTLEKNRIIPIRRMAAAKPFAAVL